MMNVNYHSDSSTQKVVISIGCFALLSGVLRFFKVPDLMNYGETMLWIFAGIGILVRMNWGRYLFFLISVIQIWHIGKNLFTQDLAKLAQNAAASQGQVTAAMIFIFLYVLMVVGCSAYLARQKVKYLFH
jgi:hypothetical protein